jgi:hypothetical protein
VLVDVHKNYSGFLARFILSGVSPLDGNQPLMVSPMTIYGIIICYAIPCGLASPDQEAQRAESRLHAL